MVSHYYPFIFENQALPDDRERAEALGHRVREFSDFVVNVLGVRTWAPATPGAQSSTPVATSGGNSAS